MIESEGVTTEETVEETVEQTVCGREKTAIDLLLQTIGRKNIRAIMQSILQVEVPNITNVTLAFSVHLNDARVTEIGSDERFE